MEVNNSNAYYGLSIKSAIKFDSNCLKLAVNLNSSNTTPLDVRDGWQQLSGWSESIFKYIEFSKKSTSITQKLLKESVI